jgi:hypothetical protein
VQEPPDGQALVRIGEALGDGVAGRAGSDVAAMDLWQNNNALRGVYLGGALLAEYPGSTR